ncbi:histidine utilization repressor [uncultured Shewanella sp.]|uniref:histidine utilization repressor n=1 Tax=uncultured Shewanella sp. TaxID=173975 RepID=UPI00262A7946|nr:histidine utilization repressor [uncultured Shewanella sp.]
MAQAKFLQIKQHILTKVDSGKWREGHKLPSENQLATDFACSRMTARRALTELTEQGILRRAQGMGSFVASHKAQSSILLVRDIRQEIEERGHRYSVKLLTQEALPVDYAQADLLNLNEGELVFYSKLVHLEEDIPLQIEERYVLPSRVPHYLEQNFSQMTPHAYLCQVAPLAQVEHTIEAVLANDSQCQLLQISHKEPCLQISRLTASRQGVVSFAKLLYPGTRFKLGGQLVFNN